MKSFEERMNRFEQKSPTYRFLTITASWVTAVLVIRFTGLVDMATIPVKAAMCVAYYVFGCGPFKEMVCGWMDRYEKRKLK